MTVNCRREHYGNFMKYKICIDTKQERNVLAYEGKWKTESITTKLSCRLNPQTGKRAGFSLSQFRDELKRIRRERNYERSMQRRSMRIV